MKRSIDEQAISSMISIAALWITGAFRLGAGISRRIQAPWPIIKAVAGASVTLNNNTGVSATRSTDATGYYLFDLVEPEPIP